MLYFEVRFRTEKMHTNEELAIKGYCRGANYSQQKPLLKDCTENSSGRNTHMIKSTKITSKVTRTARIESHYKYASK